jgi:tetratricopeptide (TPR) repeat protein
MWLDNPGRYKLAVSLPSDALESRSRQLRNALARNVTFELRSPETVPETADAYLQLAYVFTQQERHGDARQWAEKVLSLKPASIAALVEIGASWLRENNCTMAVPLLERAIRAIESGDDSELRMSTVAREDWAATLRGTLRTRRAR